MHQKAFGVRARWGSLERSPDPLAWLRGGTRVKREREGDRWCTGGMRRGKVEGEEWGGQKGWKRGKGREEKGTEGWGRKLGRDWGLWSSKNSFKSRGPRPTLTLNTSSPLYKTLYMQYICNLGIIPCVLLVRLRIFNTSCFINKFHIRSFTHSWNIRGYPKMLGVTWHGHAPF